MDVLSRPATASDLFVPPARTRSELLARRRQEDAADFQNTYNRWETQNPAWARRLTGPAAAAALGYGGDDSERPFPTRRDMLLHRRQTSRTNAMKASGFGEDVQAKLIDNHSADTMTTNLSRPKELGATTQWIDEPRHKSRSELRAERRADNVRTLDASAERNAREGKLDSEQRVQQRIDQNIAYLQQAPTGMSRQELLASRRRERANDALAAYQAYSPPQPPKFSDQPEPFWKLTKEVAPKVDYTTTTEEKARATLSHGAAHAASQAKKLEDFASTLPPGVQEEMAPRIDAVKAHAANAASAASVHSSASASAPQLLPNGSQSAEMLAARQKWWAKPDVYPFVGPAEPRAEEPFKLQKADGGKYLHKKLSSGPKKAQRGYPPEKMQISGKVTMLPPPSLAHFTDQEPRKPFQPYTGATFKFLPSEPREVVPGQDTTAFDGYEFTQPLYSSFTADKTFQPPKLPPRPRARQGSIAIRERARPSTTTGTRGPGEQPRSAPTAPGMGGFGPVGMDSRPGTVAMGALRG